MTKYTCLCCGYKTHYRKDHHWDICLVCYWESCPIGNNNPLQVTGPNAISLAEAQQNFILFGACEGRFVHFTRLPLEEEEKDESFMPYDETITGRKYVKRHWGEASGQIQTNDWGVCTYYLELNDCGEVLKQIQIYANGKLLKYSSLHNEDEFGGLALVTLDINEEGYKPLLQNTFYNIWNIPKIERFTKNKLCFAGWYLPICQKKILFPNPQFNEDETIVKATLDNRIVIDLSYQKGEYHFPRNGVFLLEAIEGNVGIHYFTYINWEDALAATQNWINDITAINKIVNTPKQEEAKVYTVHVNIDNDIVKSKLTTWRNMDWEIEKFRNVQLEVNGDVFSANNTFQDFENMLLVLQNSLPKNYQIETCFFCRFSNYNVAGNDNFGDLNCFKHCKEKCLTVKSKDDMVDLWQTEYLNITKVEETFYCSEFEKIQKGDFVFKNVTK